MLKIVTTIIRNYEVSRQYEELVSVIRQEQAARAVPEELPPVVPKPEPVAVEVPSVSTANGGPRGHTMQLLQQVQPDTSIVE